MIVHLLPTATVHVCYEWNMTACSIPPLQPSVENQQPKKIPLQNVPQVHVLRWLFHKRQSKAIHNCALFLNNLFTLLWLLLSRNTILSISSIYEKRTERERHGEENMRAHFHFNVPGWKDLMALTYPSRLTVMVMCRLLLSVGFGLPLVLMGY